MTVLDTPEGISYFQLAQLKGALKLESVGLKTRGGALRPKLAKEFGLSARAPHSEFIGVIVAKMNAILEARNAGTPDPIKDR